MNMCERMGFKVHLAVIRKKIVTSVICMRRMLRKEWGLGKKAVSTLYQGLWLACTMYVVSS